MHTRDKDFEYIRIGKGTEQLDGSKIEYPDDLAVSFNNIVMNKERLNYSISTYAEAEVHLDPEQFKNDPFTKDDLEFYDIPERVPVTMFRTYTIIADGRLQTKKLVVSGLSKETINSLGSILTLRDDKKYIVDFTSLPIINKTYINMTSGVTLAQHVWREKILTDQISLYNFYKKQTEEALGKKSIKKSDFSEEATQFLATHCYIKNNSYNPPVKAITENDEYEAYSFSINIQGFSKAQASSVVKKLDDGKNITQRELIIKEAYTNFHDAPRHRPKGEVLLKNIEEDIAELNKELKDVRRFIQLSKFAIILGNKCKMDEFESRESMSLSIDLLTLNREKLDVTFDFKIEKIKIKL